MPQDISQLKKQIKEAKKQEKEQKKREEQKAKELKKLQKEEQKRKKRGGKKASKEDIPSKKEKNWKTSEFDQLFEPELLIHDKELRHFSEVSPYKKITKENFVLMKGTKVTKGVDTYCSFYRVATTDIYQLDNTEFAMRSGEFARFNRLNLTDFGVIILKLPLVAEPQKKHYERLLERAETEEQRQSILVMINKLMQCEMSLLSREYILVMYADTLAQMEQIHRSMQLYSEFILPQQLKGKEIERLIRQMNNLNSVVY